MSIFKLTLVTLAIVMATAFPQDPSDVVPERRQRRLSADEGSRVLGSTIDGTMVHGDAIEKSDVSQEQPDKSSASLVQSVLSSSTPACCKFAAASDRYATCGQFCGICKGCPQPWYDVFTSGTLNYDTPCSTTPLSISGSTAPQPPGGNKLICQHPFEDSTGSPPVGWTAANGNNMQPPNGFGQATELTHFSTCAPHSNSWHGGPPEVDGAFFKTYTVNGRQATLGCEDGKGKWDYQE